MFLNIDIAKRYLLGKKSTNAINYITWISILGIAIGTAALVLILSVFNGFKSFISGMNSSFIPNIKVVPYEGKYLSIDSSQIFDIQNIEGIVSVSKTIEEVAIIKYKEVQKPGIIKGVDKYYADVTGMDTTLIRGYYKINNEKLDYGIVGRVLGVNLSLNPNDNISSLEVYTPSKNKSSMMSKMGKEFEMKRLLPSGTFNVGGDIDAQYVIASYSFVSKLLRKKNQISALEIKTSENANENFVRSSLKSILGDNLVIKNEYEQDAAFLKIMNIEKWISFLIICLVLTIIAFNMVGSLWMIVLEKRKDIAILRSMGYGTPQVRSLFVWNGLLITCFGIIAGIILALSLYYLQKNFGLIGIPDGFMIDAYPIDLKLSDFIIIIFTVLAIGGLASLLPAIRAGKVSASVRNE